MNITPINSEVLVQTLAESKILDIQDGPGACQTYVAVREGADILIFVDPLTGAGTVVHPCNEDRESGGSIHDHARAICV